MTEIAFLGTGLMGAPMVRNLLKAGFVVRVWNRTLAKAEALVPDGAILAPAPEAAVEGADVIVSMLSAGPAVAQMQDQCKAQLGKGAIWIDMSSTKPEEARAQKTALSEQGVLHLDAPVSGGTKGAEAGSLAIMAGGDSDVFDAARPVLEAMGRPVLVGPTGSGQLSKLANQAIVAVTIGAVAEAMLLLEQGGADPAAVRTALKGGFADSVILQQHGERMSPRNFAPGGLSKYQLKDLDNLLAEAGSLNLTLPVSEHIQARFKRFCDDLNGADQDHSGLYLELREQNGLE